MFLLKNLQKTFLENKVKLWTNNFLFVNLCVIINFSQNHRSIIPVPCSNKLMKRPLIYWRMLILKKTEIIYYLILKTFNYVNLQNLAILMFLETAVFHQEPLLQQNQNGVTIPNCKQSMSKILTQTKVITSRLFHQGSLLEKKLIIFLKFPFPRLIFATTTELLTRKKE